jgi:hypothetical protein
MTARISECGYCHETQFTAWYSKSAPRDRYGRMDRDYVDSEPVAYCSEEHRDAADALAEAVAREGALPMPVGPQMPAFPPAPQSFEEKLRADVARLQDLLAEAVAETHRARGERDEMRERVSEPYGCQNCGIAKRSHGRRWTTGVGYHAWTAPTQEQIAERMRARRTVRLASRVKTLAKLRARVAELEAERHSTNEALSDAAVRMRADRDRIAELEALTPARVQTCRVCGAGYTYGEPCSSCEFRTRMAAELQARGLDGEHYATVHHDYRVGHDLPETGGQQ